MSFHNRADGGRGKALGPQLGHHRRRLQLGHRGQQAAGGLGVKEQLFRLKGQPVKRHMAREMVAVALGGGGEQEVGSIVQRPVYPGNALPGQHGGTLSGQHLVEVAQQPKPGDIGAGMDGVPPQHPGRRPV